MEQLALLQVESKLVALDQWEIAREMELSMMAFCHLEANLNNDYYGIPYWHRTELSGFRGHTFPWLKLENPIPPKTNQNWKQIYQEYQSERQDKPNIITPPKTRLIAQWSIEAKQRNRCRRLETRLHHKYSIPTLYHEAVMAAVVKNPNYYGVCILPSESYCVYTPLINQRQQEAIERENQIRLNSRKY